MTTPEPRPCRGCGMPIVFVKSAESGKLLPLQKVKTIYYIENVYGKAAKVDWSEGDEGMHAGDIEHYVSHFETCPEARQFTRRKKG